MIELLDLPDDVLGVIVKRVTKLASFLTLRKTCINLRQVVHADKVGNFICSCNQLLTSSRVHPHDKKYVQLYLTLVIRTNQLRPREFQIKKGISADFQKGETIKKSFETKYQIVYGICKHLRRFNIPSGVSLNGTVAKGDTLIQYFNQILSPLMSNREITFEVDNLDLEKTHALRKPPFVRRRIILTSHKKLRTV